jgi:N utilization substance protein A
MKNEFVLAFNEVLEEKGLPRETILDALGQALVSAYRKTFNASSAQEIEAVINLEKGEFIIMTEKEVVDSVQNEFTEVTLEVARLFDENAQLGDIVMVDSTPEDFGRVAAQTARQAIQQKIRDAENMAQIKYYEKQLGEIIGGVVQAVNAQGITLGLELNAEGFMPRKELIPREHFRVHDRVRALVTEIKDSGRGPQIILSRTHRDFLRRLLENEVPEIFHGVVEIRSIAREPGQRAKVAVSATQQGIDPVGACVGQRGVRIQAIVRELHDEKIDVIEWNSDPTVFISKAISPARVNGVYLKENISGPKNALVIVPEDQLSLAIGRDGQNARLAAKLTNWRIDIKSLSESISDWLFALQNNDQHKEIAEQEKEAVAQAEDIMARKAEGRVITNDELDFLSALNDRLERGSVRKQKEVVDAFKAKREEILQAIPKGAFSLGLDATGLASNLIEALVEAGIENAGDLVLRSKLTPDELLEISGIGPKTLEKIQEFAETLPELELEEEEPVSEAETVVEDLAEEDLPPVQEADQAGAQPAVEPEVLQPEQPVEAADEKEAVGEQVETVGEALPEEELSFDEMFKLKPDTLEEVAVQEDEDESSESGTTSKKKKKKKGVKSRELEYDPDLDMTIAKKKHKRGEGEWDNW